MIPRAPNLEWKLLWISQRYLSCCCLWRELLAPRYICILLLSCQRGNVLGMPIVQAVSPNDASLLPVCEASRASREGCVSQICKANSLLRVQLEIVTKLELRPSSQSFRKAERRSLLLPIG